MIELPRRKFLAGLGAAICAPAIVRASSLMPVRACAVEDLSPQWDRCSVLTEETIEHALRQISTLGGMAALRLRPTRILVNQSLWLAA